MVAAVIAAGSLVMDRMPRFFQGDLIAYLSTGFNGWIPPDRSWAYGFLSRWLIETTRYVSSLPALQALLLAGAILMLACEFGGRQSHIASLAIVILASVDPLNQTYARFWLSDTIASAAFLMFVSLVAACLRRARWRNLLPALLLSCSVSIFVRVAYLPVELATLAIIALSASVVSQPNRPARLRRTCAALALIPVLAAGSLALANSQVSIASLHGQFFLNRSSGLFQMGVFLPGLRYEDFQRAHVPMSRVDFDQLHLNVYDQEMQIWADGPQHIRWWLQQHLQVNSLYDAQFQAMCSAVLRSALIHHPQTLPHHLFRNTS